MNAPVAPPRPRRVDCGTLGLAFPPRRPREGGGGPRRYVDPPVPRQDSPGGARRPPQARRRDALAGQGDRRRSIPGRAAREAPEARPLLGHRIRLAQGRGQAQCLSPVRDDDRRARHSFHPRPLAPSERDADHHHARLAGLDLRATEDHRTAHRPHRTWRTCRGRLRRRHPVRAGLRLLRQADGHRLGPRPHRANLGGADEAPRVHPLPRPGRRLGCPHLQRDGAPGAGRIARHPPQLAGDGPARGGCSARQRRGSRNRNARSSKRS